MHDFKKNGITHTLLQPTDPLGQGQPNKLWQLYNLCDHQDDG